MKNHTLALCAALSAAAIAITSCSATDNGSTPPSSTEPSAADSADSAHSHDGFDSAEGETEVAQLPTRIVLSHKDGLTTIDGETGEVIGTEDLKAFLRLSDAGDNRHVMVTKGDSFLTFDTGRITKPHGDHKHYYTAEPKLGDGSLDAPSCRPRCSS